MREFESKEHANDLWKGKFDPFEYYKFTRDEIKREDDLTNHRITTSLTFFGFVVAASGFIISQFVSSTNFEAKKIYFSIAGAIGLIGLSSTSRRGRDCSTRLAFFGLPTSTWSWVLCGFCALKVTVRDMAAPENLAISGAQERRSTRRAFRTAGSKSRHQGAPFHSRFN